MGTNLDKEGENEAYRVINEAFSESSHATNGIKQGLSKHFYCL